MGHTWVVAGVASCINVCKLEVKQSGELEEAGQPLPATVLQYREALPGEATFREIASGSGQNFRLQRCGENGEIRLVSPAGVL